MPGKVLLLPGFLCMEMLPFTDKGNPIFVY